LILILFLTSACGFPSTTTESPDSDRNDRGGTHESIEPAVEEWIDDNMDDLSEQIGELVTGDLPIARDIVAEAVKRALLSYLEWKIIEVETSEDKRERIARVRLVFPLRLELQVISREYQIRVDYVLRIRENRVVDSDIDLDSFKME